MPDELEQLLGDLETGDHSPVYLVGGDRVLAEPAAVRIAETLASAYGCQVSSHRRPARLSMILDDLRTYSLFDSGKVVMVVDCAIFADRSSAAELLDDAAEVLPIADPDALTPKELEGASRALQALRLFGLDPLLGDSSELLAQLPKWALEGGSSLRRKRPRGRGSKQVAELALGLGELLKASRVAGLEGFAEGDVAVLGSLLDGGLPERHCLVLAESRWAPDHPVAKRLLERGACVSIGGVELDRRGKLTGLEKLARGLRDESGVSIGRRALEELARRTLKKSAQRGRQDEVDPDSTARFAAEYRKLAGLATGDQIELELVERVVEDRGQEDVWGLLDDIAAGRTKQALGRLRRLELAAEDTVGSRLSVFALLADYCRQVVSMSGLLAMLGAHPVERNYNRFKSVLAPSLQAPLPDGLENPISRLHPYRLHRVYLAALRLDSGALGRLPSAILDAEARLKGESGDANAALAALVATVSEGQVPTLGPRVL